MLTEGHEVHIEDLPAAQTAFAAIEQIPDETGGTRARVDRRGRLRFDYVWVHRAGNPPSPDTVTGITERDLRWLAEKPRRGQRAIALAPAASASGLFRLLYDLDLTAATSRLGRLRRIEPRPEAAQALRNWSTGIAAVDAKLVERLTDALPPAALTWVNNDGLRLIAGIAASSPGRSALANDLCVLASHLPSEGIPLSALADTVVQHTHGLDIATPKGRLAARLAAAIAGLPPPSTTAEIRAAWEAVGVWVDQVSSQVATWRLPLHPSHPAARVSRTYDEIGQPAVLTLGLLRDTHAPLLTAPTDDSMTIWVVEGLSTLTAAVAANVTVPVVCRGGTPSVAVTRLVTAAASAGWNIAVSSDFEPRGLQGAITLMQRAGPASHPWRLSAADYRAGSTEGDPFPPEQVPDTPWDPQLAAAMRHRRQRVSEESRLALLVEDLQTE